MTILELLQETIDQKQKEISSAVDSWIQHKKINDDTIKLFLSYPGLRPTSPITLYRGIKPTTKVVNKPYVSYTHDEEIARKFAGRMGTVEEKEIQPEDIIIDFSLLPMEIKRELEIATRSMLYKESEVLVRTKN